ncbi:unnamed protein product [Heterosigma akashiwo]
MTTTHWSLSWTKKLCEFIILDTMLQAHMLSTRYYRPFGNILKPSTLPKWALISCYITLTKCLKSFEQPLQMLEVVMSTMSCFGIPWPPAAAAAAARWTRACWTRWRRASGPRRGSRGPGRAARPAVRLWLGMASVQLALGAAGDPDNGEPGAPGCSAPRVVPAAGAGPVGARLLPEAPEPGGSGLRGGLLGAHRLGEEVARRLEDASKHMLDGHQEL